MSYDSSWLTIKRQQRALYAHKVKETTYKNAIGGPVILQNTYRGGMTYSSHFYDTNVGAIETTIAEEETYISTALQYVTPTPPAPEPPSGSGSMVFTSTYGGAGSYVQYPNDSSLTIGTQSFTIEWYQYFESGASFPRIFSIGTYPTTDIGVSYEGSFYVWINNSPNYIGAQTDYNTSAHIAIVGTSGVGIKVYVNGSELGEIPGSYNIGNTTSNALTIGNETLPTSDAAFTGKISNFRWVVGSALYSGSFIPPNIPLENITGTQLLLLSTSEADVVADSSDAARIPTNEGVTYTSEPIRIEI